jgi:phosphoribosylformimino-5-aminoimidazole carboxamide ribotide isomerase
MRFRPCIDLHAGVVKQIVGGTLSEDGATSPRVNYESDLPPSYYARLYREDDLTGGHVIMLGPGNEAAAREALAAWPGGLQVGGGITLENAVQWLDAGASHVIVTSYVFRDGVIDFDRLSQLAGVIGPHRLVLDLSCRRRGASHLIVTDRWQRFTEVEISESTLSRLAAFCSEFLVHAADVEGLCSGIDEELVTRLSAESPIPTTYAGGVASMSDIKTIDRLGRGRLDVTVGSALDLFGGRGLTYTELVAYHRASSAHPTLPLLSGPG